MPLSIIILAAGQGTRMRSSRPKVIHELADKPLVQHVIDTARELQPQQVIVVVGHEARQVRDSVTDQGIEWVKQTEQLGTGHAVSQCLDTLAPGNDVLVLYGDVPLTLPDTLARLVAEGNEAVVATLSFIAANPTGYGRILRDAMGNFIGIREHKDASDSEKSINECNSGIMWIRGDRLAALLDGLGYDNAQGEYYLTDLVGLCVAGNHPTIAISCDSEAEVLGVNNQQQLAEVESIYRHRQAEILMEQGTKLFDPSRLDIRGNLKVGEDVVIDINCIFSGEVSLGDGVRIGANCVIHDSTIAANSEILPFTSMEGVVVGERVTIGPFARIRPETRLAEGAKIGNFVEIKKASIGKGSKVNHLSYVGDTLMGNQVNIGAGTITCNYDGANKHQTIIEDRVFVGSDTQLVAPVKVGAGAVIGAGSTITREVPEEKLTLSRSKQMTLNNWQRPQKKEK